MTPFCIHGICPATHTPFHADGSLNLEAIEKQAAYLQARRIAYVFIGGTTGESASLTLSERMALGERWAQVSPTYGIRVVVHVGAQSLADAAELAAQAQRNKASAVSMIAPSYFKPRSLDDLVASCAQVAAAAPELPFYYYDIPTFTGITTFAVDDFLRSASLRIPNLAGVKYSNADLSAFLLGRRMDGGKFDLPWGIDECFLAALAMGAQGGVGSTYNFAPGPIQRMILAFAKGDLSACHLEQERQIKLVRILARRGYMGCAKALMMHLGVPVGPARLPNGNPDSRDVHSMLSELESIGFFSWKD